MRPRAIAFITLLALAAAPGAAAGPSPTAGGGADPWSCGPWIAVAEQQYAIPTGLLQAVGLTETGMIPEELRPWALNVDGEPFAVASLSLAARTVMQRARTVSVDVGCLQINLRAHVETVPNLSWLFLPKYNAAYGGWYLAQLFARHGSWGQAVAAYHAGSPDRARGAAYCRRVAAAFAGLRPGASLACPE